jgi:hypothetical protein
MSASLDQAKAVKSKLSQNLSRVPAVNGVGLARDGNGWAVKVNLSGNAQDLNLPKQIEGVAIWTSSVGRIVAQ